MRIYSALLIAAILAPSIACLPADSKLRDAGSREPSLSSRQSGPTHASATDPAPRTAEPHPSHPPKDGKMYVWSRLDPNLPGWRDKNGHWHQGYEGRDGRNHGRLNKKLQEIGGSHTDVVVSSWKEGAGAPEATAVALGLADAPAALKERDDLKGAPTDVFFGPYEEMGPLRGEKGVPDQVGETLRFRGYLEGASFEPDILHLAERLNKQHGEVYDADGWNCEDFVVSLVKELHLQVKE